MVVLLASNDGYKMLKAFWELGHCTSGGLQDVLHFHCTLEIIFDVIVSMETTRFRSDT